MEKFTKVFDNFGDETPLHLIISLQLASDKNRTFWTAQEVIGMSGVKKRRQHLFPITSQL